MDTPFWDAGSYSKILRRVNEKSRLVQLGPDGTPAREFTGRDGLAGNIVTNLAATNDALWAACLDFYDREKKERTIGGLCRYLFDFKYLRLKKSSPG